MVSNLYNIYSNEISGVYSLKYKTALATIKMKKELCTVSSYIIDIL